MWFSTERTRRIKIVAAVCGGVVLVALVMIHGPATISGVWLALVAAVCCSAAGLVLNKWSKMQHYIIPLAIFILVIIEVAL